MSSSGPYLQTPAEFYVRGSVPRNSGLKKPNEMQQYANIYLLQNYSTCFERPSRPSSGVHKTVVAVPEVATTGTRGCNYSFMYPDDGRGGRPKHVE